MIPRSTIERIRSAADIVDVISEFVSLRKAGTSYKGLCPFHDDTTPSFSVSPSRGLYKCFACGEGGDVVRFIMQHEQISYVEALKYLGKKYGIEVEERELTDEERQTESERESMYVVNEWACNYFHDILLSNPDGQAIGLAYFRSRGFRDDIVEKFRLGFCLSQHDAMSKAALKAGYNDKYLQQTGLSYKNDAGQLKDKYWGRVIFPWIGVNGKVVGFGGRVLDARTKGVSQKYINSPESIIYSKGKLLYGLFQAKKAISREDNVYMVEGYTDVLSMHQCGIENVVANSGTALSEDQIRLLHRFTPNITFLYDGDKAGIKAAMRGIDMVLKHDMRIKIVLFPDGDDPDSFARKHNATEFKEYVDSHKVDFIQFMTDILHEEAGDDPMKRADMIKSITKTISVIPSEIDRATYAHVCGERLHVDEAILLRQINRYRKEARDERDRQKRLREQSEGNQLGANSSDEQSGAVNSDGGSSGDGSSNAEATAKGMNGRQLSNEEARFINLERMIMMLLVRFGEKQYSFDDGTGKAVRMSLIDYVSQNLKNDNLTFYSPLYRKMLNELVSAEKPVNFMASTFLLSSPDGEMSCEVSELLTERYKLSQDTQKTLSEENMSAEYISHLMMDYKYCFVDAQLADILKEIAKPEVQQDFAKTCELIKRQGELTKIRKTLAFYLGERIT